MPIPLIIWGAAIAFTALTGAKKSYDGYSMSQDGKQIASDAEDKHKRESNNLDQYKEVLHGKASEYGEYLLNVKVTTIKRMVDFLQTINKQSSQKAFEIVGDFEVSVGSIKEYEQSRIEALKILSNAHKAAGAGAAAGAAATSMVGLLGTAGTGASIGSLSGIAAQNATLAWLGGGSLAAGGGGMAAGTIVLGGIYLAQVLFVAGYMYAKKAEKELTKAKEYESEVNVAVEKIKYAAESLRKISDRIDELKMIIYRINKQANDAIDELKVEKFNIDDDNNIKKLSFALQLVKAISEILRTPIINEKGELTTDSFTIAAKYKKYGG